MADNMECGGEKLLTESGLKYMLKKMTGKILLAVGVIRAEGDAPLTLWREETDDGITVRGSVDLSSCATADGLANEVSAREGADDALRTAIDGKQDAGNYATKDEIPDVSGLVTKTDADNDYASKDDTYTKSEVDDLVKNAEAGGDVDLSGYQRKLSYYSEGNQCVYVGGADDAKDGYGRVEVDMIGAVYLQTGASGSKEHELKLANDGSLMLDGDKVLTEADVEDSLTSTATNRALSANQGYVLNHSKQDKLTAGENITISDDNVISAAGMSSLDKTRLDELWEHYQAGDFGCKCETQITYDAPQVTLSYEDIPAEGGSVLPSLSFSQEWRDNKGNSGTLYADTTDWTAEYSLTASSGAELNTTNGEVSIGENTTNTNRMTVATVSVTVTANGVSGSATKMVYQEAVVIAPVVKITGTSSGLPQETTGGAAKKVYFNIDVSELNSAVDQTVIPKYFLVNGDYKFEVTQEQVRDNGTSSEWTDYWAELSTNGSVYYLYCEYTYQVYDNRGNITYSTAEARSSNFLVAPSNTSGDFYIRS